MTVDPYETLGVDKNASADDVKKAYRSRAKRSHPDRAGDDAEFCEVHNAYLVLSDPAKRKRFDETGQTEDAAPAVPFMNVLVTTLGAVLNRFINEISTTHVVKEMRTIIEEAAAKQRDNKKTVEKARASLEKALAKLKDRPQSVLISTLEREIANATSAIETFDAQLRVNEEALEYLAGCDYEADVATYAGFTFTDGRPFTWSKT